MIECPRCGKECKNKRALSIHWGHMHDGDPPDYAGSEDDGVALEEIPPVAGVTALLVLAGGLGSQIVPLKNASMPIVAIVAISCIGILYFIIRFKQIQSRQGFSAAGKWAMTPPCDMENEVVSFSDALSQTDTSKISLSTSGGDNQTLKNPELDELQSMEDYDFEKFVARVWSDRGWNTEVTQASNDRGIDIVAEKDEPYQKKAIIQAKRYQSGNKVGSTDIQQYNSLRQQEPGVDEVIIVTTSSFTEPARELAQDLNVKMVNGEKLADIAEKGTIDSEEASISAEDNASVNSNSV